MIIGIAANGINHGKSTVAEILQIIIDSPHYTDKAVESFIGRNHIKPSFTIEKFGSMLKNVVCLLLDCTREQLEDNDFKNKELGEKWTKYAYADRFQHIYTYKNGKETKETVMISVPCSKERYEEELRINHQTAYKTVMTPRLLMQWIGTDAFRNIIHPNIHVNSLMNKYKAYYVGVANPIDIDSDSTVITKYPNWIIDDMRFLNEYNAVINITNHVTIKVIKDVEDTKETKHASEVELLDVEMDYTIHNNGTILELIGEVRKVYNAINIH